jgi:tRNA threonylcarbamoyladenosine biosynthesis protein TsaB
MTHPSLLGLDTSTDDLAVGLSRDGHVVGRQVPGGPQASAQIIPLLMQLMHQASLPLAQVQAIAFGQGPGAFTGLRTACAVTQGLAFAHNTPVLPIASLLIVAEDARMQDVALADQAQTWWVAMDARMDEVYAAAYHFDGLQWQVQQAPGLWSLATLSQTWLAAPPRQVAGSAIAAFGARLPWGAARLCPHTQDRPQALMRLALAAWQAGHAVTASEALPLYLRDKVAQTTAERMAQKAASA